MRSCLGGIWHERSERYEQSYLRSRYSAELVTFRSRYPAELVTIRSRYPAELVTLRSCYLAELVTLCSRRVKQVPPLT